METALSVFDEFAVFYRYFRPISVFIGIAWVIYVAFVNPKKFSGNNDPTEAGASVQSSAPSSHRSRKNAKKYM